MFLGLAWAADFVSCCTNLGATLSASFLTRVPGLTRAPLLYTEGVAGCADERGAASNNSDIHVPMTVRKRYAAPPMVASAVEGDPCLTPDSSWDSREYAAPPKKRRTPTGVAA